MKKTRAQELHEEFLQKQKDRRTQSTPQKTVQETVPQPDKRFCDPNTSVWECVMETGQWGLTTI